MNPLTYQTLYRKYRSQTFSDLVGQEAVSRALQGAIASGRVAHLTVVAHSQGTIIALDVLHLAWAKRLLRGVEVRLVTLAPDTAEHLVNLTGFQEFCPNDPRRSVQGVFLNDEVGTLHYNTVSIQNNVITGAAASRVDQTDDQKTRPSNGSRSCW